MKKSKTNLRNIIVLSAFAAGFSFCALSAVGRDRIEVAEAAEVTDFPAEAENMVNAEDVASGELTSQTDASAENALSAQPEMAAENVPSVQPEMTAENALSTQPEMTAENAPSAQPDMAAENEPATAADVAADNAVPAETDVAALTAQPADNGIAVTEFDNPMQMYTTVTVNVRDGAGTEYAKVGKLAWGSAATVTGETSNGWYEVSYDGTNAFIKGDYMTQQMPGTPYVFVGDSRTVQLQMAVGSTDKAYIAQVGEGYTYFKNTALPAISNYAGAGTSLIINFGVNDLANASKYITLVNNNIDAWTEAGITVYYAAVTPVGNCTTVTNSQIESFNSKLQSELDPRVKWMDGYSYLTQTGFSTPDGLHYSADTYRSLYAYYMSVIGQSDI